MKITKSYLKRIIKEELEDIESSPILQLQRKIMSLLRSVNVTLTGGDVYTRTASFNIYECRLRTDGGGLDGQIYHDTQKGTYGITLKQEPKTRFPIPYHVIDAAKAKVEPVLKDVFDMMYELVAMNRKRQSGIR